MLQLLEKSGPEAQLELIRALVARRERETGPVLLKVASSPDARVQLAALNALAQLADGSSVSHLIARLLAAESDPAREATELAVVSVAARLEQESIADAVLRAAESSQVSARCAALRTAGKISPAKSLAALRSALKDPAPELREVAVRVLAENGGLEAAGDLLAVAREAPTELLRVLATRGYWRVVGLAKDRSLDERMRLCDAGLAIARRPEEKRAALAELVKLPDPRALKAAQSYCADETVKAEAELACVQLASKLLSSHRTAAEAVLRTISSEASSEAEPADAKAKLDSLVPHKASNQ